MSRQKSRTQRKAEFLQAAEAMYERLEDWYDAHPAASFEELEAELRDQRRELLGQTLATLIVGRDTGFALQPAACAQCGRPREFIGYRPWTVKGLEGDSRLERAYYTCPVCEGQGFSPSGPEATAARRPLECRCGAGGDAPGAASQVLRFGGGGFCGCGGAQHVGR